MSLNIATLAEAETYFGERLRTTAWDDATDDERRRALSQADAIFESCVAWNDGAFEVDSDETKSFVSPVKNAFFEEALYLLKLDPTEYPELLTIGVGVGSGSTFDKSFVAPLLSPTAVRLLGMFGRVVVNEERGGRIASGSLNY